MIVIKYSSRDARLFPYKEAKQISLIIKNKQQTTMKLFNSAITLGALAYVSEGIALQSLLSASAEENTENLVSLDSNLVNRASAETQIQVGDVMNGAVALAKAAQEVGLTNWWGWYVVAIVDATADLVTDVVSDVTDWGLDAANGVKPFVEDLAGDIDKFITDAVEDVGDWGDHVNQRQFSEVADDLHSWVGDVQTILTEAITEAADGSIEFIGDVAEDITEWINDAAVDAEDISDGTYCFERHCPQNEQQANGLAQTKQLIIPDPAAFAIHNIRERLIDAFNNLHLP